VLPTDWTIVKEESEAGGAMRWTISVAQNAKTTGNGSERMSNSRNGLASLLADPPPLVAATQEAVLDGYAFTVSAPVTSVNATSTRVERITPRIVPAYTLAVEPKQVVEVVTKPRKPFEVLLRVHSYATQPGKISVGVDVPRGWKGSAEVPLKFEGAGDQYARLTVTPPVKLAAGNYKIAARAIRSADRAAGVKAEKFVTSLEPLPTLPAQLWSEPAQCAVHAFAVRVPENQLVGYITAESEPVPDALQRLGIHIEMLDPAALAF